METTVVLLLRLDVVGKDKMLRDRAELIKAVLEG